MKKALLLSLPLILICLAQALAGNSSIVAGNAPAGQTPYWGSSAAGAPQVELPPPPEGPSAPDQRTILQGGDNVSDAFVIPSLPFEDNGTTSGYTDDYADPCGGTFGGPDVVYSYTPSVDKVVNIHLCGTTFYCVLYVFQNTPDNVIACNSFSLICGYDIPRGALDGLQLYAGNTYYIVIDGYYTSQGPYSIQVAEPPHVECPPTAIAENEPNCGDGYVDQYNSGCNDTTLEVFSSIAINDTICGTTGVFNGGSARDTDWYRLTISDTQLLTWGAVAECPIQIFIFYAGDCSNLIDMNAGYANAGDTVRISANCIPGTYYFYISPQNFDPTYACPITYLAWLNSTPSQPAPADDNCADVTPVQLVPGTPVTVTGDNTWATMDCISLGMPETWVAFTLDVTANVTLDYCGTNPAFGSCFIVLEDQCPCGNYIGCNMYSQYICEDHNFTLRWDDLGPGTYYYPVMSKWGVCSGPYTIHLKAEGQPEINVTPAQIEGQALVGNTTNSALTIENTGTDQLNYSIVTTQTPERLLSVKPFNPNSAQFYSGVTREPERVKVPTITSGDTERHLRTLQGGENMDDAYIITSLPFTDNGNTTGANDDYIGSCGQGGGSDVVYAFSPPYDMRINVSLCGSSFDTKLYIMENTAENTIACNDDYCGTQSQLDEVPVSSASVYFIVVDGYDANASGDYVINVSEFIPCAVECPAGSVAEAEPCGQDLNGGCNATPPAYEPIAENSTVCGTAWSDPSLRDTDWYLFSPTEPTYLSINVAADFPMITMLLDASYGCPPSGQPIPAGQLLWGWIVPACTTATGSMTLMPGSYWVFVAPYGYPNFPNIPCDGSGDFGNDYYVSLHNEPAWLQVSSNFGTIPLFGAPNNINVTLDATRMSPGTYHGEILVSSNAVTNPNITVPVTFTVNPNGPRCTYTPGDVNNRGGFTGLDVVYGVAYLKGGPPPPYSCECTPGHTWFVTGDVNASCSFTGLDITYMVAYLKGGPLLRPCPDCPPAGTGLGLDKVVPAGKPSNEVGVKSAN